MWLSKVIRNRVFVVLLGLASVLIVAFIAARAWNAGVRPMFHNIYRPHGDRGGGWTLDWPLIDSKGRWVLIDDRLNILVWLLPTEADSLTEGAITLHRRFDWQSHRAIVHGYPLDVEVRSDMANRLIVVRADGSLVWTSMSTESGQRLASVLRAAQPEMDYSLIADAALSEDPQLRRFIQAELATAR